MRNFWNKIIKLNACGFWLATAAAPTVADVQKSFVEVYPGRELYVERHIGKESAPTVILLNGMTYSTKDWGKFVDQLKLKSPDLNVVSYDMFGMGKTLLRYKERFSPFELVNDGNRVHYTEQARELDLLIDKLGIKGPIYLVGLSYGGAIAQEFARVSNKEIAGTFLFSPYITPLESQVKWIRLQISLVRLTQPFNMWAGLYSDGQLYDYFLKTLVYTTYPAVEPSVLENLYKPEATYRLAQGMKDFDGFTITSFLRDHKVHFVTPTKDEYIGQDVFDKYWAALPEDAKSSRLIVPGGKHKLPEEQPSLSAEWVVRVIEDKSGQLSGGKVFNSEDLGL